MKQLVLKDKSLGEDLVVHVGSFMQEHRALNHYGYITVNLMKEYQDLPSHYCIPIKDFNVPDNIQEFEEGLVNILRHSVNGDKVFFGCFGGVGRTGIVLACLSKVTGISTNLVYHTRTMLPHALETAEQIEFVKAFDATNVRRKLEELIIHKYISKAKENSELNKLLVKKIKSYGDKSDLSGIVHHIIKTHNTGLLTGLINLDIIKKTPIYDSNKSVADIAHEEKSKPSIKAAKLLKIPRTIKTGFELKSFFLLISKINEKRKKVEIKNV